MPPASEQSLKWTASFQDNVGPALTRLAQRVDRRWDEISASFVRGVRVSGRQLALLGREHLTLATAAIRQFSEGIPIQLAGMEGASVRTLRSLRSTQLQLQGPLQAMASVAQALAGVEGGGRLFQKQARGIIAAAGGLGRFRMLLSQTAKEAPEQFAKAFMAVRTLLGTQLPSDLGKAFEAATKVGGDKAAKALAEALGRKDILRILNTQLAQLPAGIRNAAQEALGQLALRAPLEIRGRMTKAVESWLGPIEGSAIAAFSRSRSRLSRIAGTLGGWSDRLVGTSPRLSKFLGDFGGALTAIGGKAQQSGGMLGALGGMIGTAIAPGIGTMIGTTVGGALESVAGAILGPLMPLLTAVAPMRLLAEALDPVIRALKNTLMPLFSPLVELLLHLTSAFQPIVNALIPILNIGVDRLMKAMMPLANMIANVISSLLVKMTPTIEMLFDTTTKLFMQLFAAMKPLEPLIVPLMNLALLPLIGTLKVLQMELKFVEILVKGITWFLNRLFKLPAVQLLLRLIGTSLGRGAERAPITGFGPAPSLIQNPISVVGAPVIAAAPVAFAAPPPVEVTTEAPPIPGATAAAGAPAWKPGGIIDFLTLFTPLSSLKLMSQVLIPPMERMTSSLKVPFMDIVSGIHDIETAVRTGQPGVPDVDPEFDQGVLHAAGMEEVWV